MFELFIDDIFGLEKSISKENWIQGVLNKQDYIFNTAKIRKIVYKEYKMLFWKIYLFES